MRTCLFVLPGLVLAAQAPVAPQTPVLPKVQVSQGRVFVHLPAEGVTVVGEPAAKGEDAGAASLDQRLDLLWKGEMTDSQGRHYNVRILPGYVEPAHRLAKGWAKAGSDLAEYGDADTWQTMGRHAKKSLRWGWETSFWEFGLKGSGKAWEKRFEKASERTARRTFGWPLAYPWAIVASTFETALRVPLGTAGAALGTGGAVVIPVVETAWPASKSLYHAGIEGVALPVGSWAWQTVAGPVAATFASAPRPSRADGLWMRVEVPRPVQATRPLLPPASPESLDTLTTLGKVTAEASAAVAPRLEALQKQLQEEMAASRKRYEAARASLEAERNAALEAWLAVPAQREALLKAARELQGMGLREARPELLKRLQATGLSESAARAALERLVVLRSAGTPTLPTKTDPILSALETTERVLSTYPK